MSRGCLWIWGLLGLFSNVAQAALAIPGEEKIVLVVRDPGAESVAEDAMADLRRTPLSHCAGIVRLSDRNRTSEESRRVLAILSLAGDGRRGSQPRIPLERNSADRFPPGWLVHAVLRSGEAIGAPYGVGEQRFSLLAQLVARSARFRRGSAGVELPDPSIPAVTLLGASSEGLAAAVRRLDALPGRPLPEDQYLVIAGRVWLRRDLMWVGFLLWVLLVFRGRPRRWRGTGRSEQRQQTKVYLPGFWLRLLLLVSVFWVPVFAVLLFPAALLALLPPRAPRLQALWVLLGCLPVLAYAAILGIALEQGSVAGFQGGAATLLIPGTLVAYGCAMARPAKAVDGGAALQ